MRLAEIDAPEKVQPFGQRSRQQLADLCFNQEANIRETARDRFGRTVARVRCQGLDASAEQVKVLVVNAEKHPERYGENPGADITAYLARHEAPVTLERMSSNGTSVPDTIRSYAVANGADLLVIGAYSRARIGELLLGGVTRNWLSKPTIPLLLAQ